jgi:nicotinamidase-related amidase
MPLPLTKSLSAARTAVIVVDLMPRIVEQDLGPHKGADVVARASRLVTAFRQAGGTVVLVRVEWLGVAEQPPGSGFVPEMQPQPGDIVVVKHSIGAFHRTGLSDQLQERHVDTVVIAGIATTMGVESTARVASDYGFEVIFAADAMSGMTAAEHDHALSLVLPRFGEVVNTDDVLDRLDAA